MASHSSRCLMFPTVALAAVPIGAVACRVSKATLTNGEGGVVGLTGYGEGDWPAEKGADHVARTTVYRGVHAGRTVYIAIVPAPGASDPSIHVTSKPPGLDITRVKIRWQDPSKPLTNPDTKRYTFVDHSGRLPGPDGWSYDDTDCRK